MNEIPQLRAIQQLGRTYRALMAAFEARIGLSMPRWRILLNLHQSGERSQKQLARDLRMDPAALTRQIKTIEQEGWVERHTDAADNRLTNVALTAAGRALVARTLPRRTAFVETAFGDMSIEEMNELSALLRTLEERLREE
ncbi:MarR family winged helix-turn-helix transcriptional regulator [Parapusillimonas granuli]|uniref:MarR family transcriptional regulator n=1 Tax=Parapusillimonas granuli TaxID=380911 RepID=A0A853G1T1_9BURK|nr:MarR family transcriptional regulator [Parapusillimonas granuli]MBB5213588.1 DNA-binding MarR family transcriptional regulator [Parapusillimonas granuli]MEB2398681.1 MarR family transcriptional regulator [Alcaligenaceae bacterium]NYT48426.1 MarR family transcriptional regulator [Parapusillimonas granuli]